MFRVSRKFPLTILSRSRIFLSSLNICYRFYTTIRPNLKLLQQLRQETQVSIIKAKEALIKHDNDYDIALSWILEDSKTSGFAKAEKLKGRVAKEGLIGIVLTKFEGKMGNTRGAIVEVNCETDFVSRNTLFKQFVTQIASTSLLLSSDVTPVSSSSSNITSFIQSIPLPLLQSSPLLPHPSSTSSSPSVNFSLATVQESTVELVGKLGENISLRRAEAVVFPGSSNAINDNNYILTGSYVHGGDSFTGKIGGLVVIKLSGRTVKQNSSLSLHSSEQINKLLGNLARQVVGFNPKYISENDIDGTNKNDCIKEDVLLNQDFLIGGGTVKDVIKEKEKELGVTIEIVDFRRWKCGEGIEKSEGDFAKEVMSQAGLS